MSRPLLQPATRDRSLILWFNTFELRSSILAMCCCFIKTSTGGSRVPPPSGPAEDWAPQSPPSVCLERWSREFTVRSWQRICLASRSDDGGRSHSPRYSCFSLASWRPCASRLSIMASPSWAFFHVLTGKHGTPVWMIPNICWVNSTTPYENCTQYKRSHPHCGLLQHVVKCCSKPQHSLQVQ